MTGAERLRALTDLTLALTRRLAGETAALEARRPQDLVAGQAETQALANAYRRDAALAKADPALLSAATPGERRALAEATQAFERVLGLHARAVEAARTVSEGLARVIAAEVAAARPAPSAYGATGAAAATDGRAFALNRTA